MPAGVPPVVGHRVLPLVAVVAAAGVVGVVGGQGGGHAGARLVASKGGQRGRLRSGVGPALRALRRRLVQLLLLARQLALLPRLRRGLHVQLALVAGQLVLLPSLVQLHVAQVGLRGGGRTGWWVDVAATA